MSAVEDHLLDDEERGEVARRRRLSESGLTGANFATGADDKLVRGGGQLGGTG